jgi:sugar phosphate isomerase/epimerase
LCYDFRVTGDVLPMRIGIRGHDVKVSTPEEVANAIKEAGFDYVQLVINKALIDDNNNPMSLDDSNVKIISEAFKKANVNVAMLGCYFNPIHSNKLKVEKSINYFIKNLELAHYFSCSYVGTETGSYNDDKWTYHPANHTVEAFIQVAEVFKILVESAKRYNATILVEPAYNHVIYNAIILQKLLNIINDEEHLKVTIDLFNLLNVENYHQYKEIFIDCLEKFGPKIKIIHLKDFIFNNQQLVQTSLGDGMIDFDFIFNNIRKYNLDATMIFEGITKEGIDRSFKHIKKFIS